MKQAYTAVVKKDGRWYVAWIKEVPGAITQARTIKELRENLLDALALMLEENQRIATMKKRHKVNREALRISMPETVEA
ncbi:hypothetical protein A3C21_02330 [Candidatus Kaiserbacteria bacterium RIFCSPHIGHO2_02_FULL_59_21]|uniref:Uncharacterized protein n=1 Tax=Candidatus Kaiserbacteria bacterium RIFCSPHIGHO2_02_FULL_59_21 TaxID=1798500 RepID=A0A1F6E087_9BACT|nr:MAG: hypothetical protein A2766_04140 [Candidatus Kaiserbacteria bacterium RIFCSPHIGHO2_01_FULL_58_22]OGG67073.1 MAG: hypothetical protein A3C21_02330 [Candidatus Kaiserbacteria bacterium RIFCSPHIGHO2_02_FULL_59_21]OGG79471.1 MAG: hypothetical protein A2952_00200 [Candidatus Kaiserbacteria bacterium RIFCSPLOWO2_01_FULL_59_34]OGG86837.1 MAG: hypothetical protein A3I47_04190 [Candidatus Kaiserbacteria bacterium RIFCSPLOWO2_02_FULL_59_19]